MCIYIYINRCAPATRMRARPASTKRSSLLRLPHAARCWCTMGASCSVVPASAARAPACHRLQAPHNLSPHAEDMPITCSLMQRTHS